MTISIECVQQGNNHLGEGPVWDVEEGCLYWVDGTGRRDCMMEDISETGAKLTVDGSVEGLHLKEFFLLLSSTGLAYRRCELAWVNGDQIGVNFLKVGKSGKKRTSMHSGDAD